MYSQRRSVVEAISPLIFPFVCRASSKCFSTDKPSAPAGWRIVWESMIKNVGLNGVLGIELEKVDESSKAVTMTVRFSVSTPCCTLANAFYKLHLDACKA
jgi:hypothetical protein